MERTLVNLSDGCPALKPSGGSAFESTVKQSGKELNILPPSFYQNFLSQTAKERLPNPSE